MPWTGKQFAAKHNHKLSGAAASEAAAQATAMIKHGVPEGEAIATANKHAGHHKGGKIESTEGPPIGKDDGIIAAQKGEYVIRKSAVEKYGTKFLDSINEGTHKVRNKKESLFNKPKGFAEGGSVDEVAQAESITDPAAKARMLKAIADTEQSAKEIAANKARLEANGKAEGGKVTKVSKRWG
jgi:uncharacterized protein YdaT